MHVIFDVALDYRQRTFRTMKNAYKYYFINGVSSISCMHIGFNCTEIFNQYVLVTFDRTRAGISQFGIVSNLLFFMNAAANRIGFIPQMQRL